MARTIAERNANGQGAAVGVLAGAPPVSRGREGRFGRLLAALLVVAGLLLAAAYGLVVWAERQPLANYLAPRTGGAVRIAGVSGTLADGHLSGVRLGPVPLPDLDVAARPQVLWQGRAQMNFAAVPGAPSLNGAAALTPGGVQFSADGRLPLDAAFAGLPVGAIELTRLDARFSHGGGCEAAAGAATLTLSVPAEYVNLPRNLSGTARCEGGALLLPFTAPDGSGLTLALSRSGWSARARLHPPADAIPALAAQGFRSEGGGWWGFRTGSAARRGAY
jgi:general secretion pathway protein N